MDQNQNSPYYHVHNMQKRLQREVNHLREDIEKIDDPQLKAMFETSAEVLKGLIKAFNDFEKKNEHAWKE